MTYWIKKWIIVFCLLFVLPAGCGARTKETPVSVPEDSDATTDAPTKSQPRTETDTETVFENNPEKTDDTGEIQTCDPTAMVKSGCIIYVDAGAKSGGCGYDWEDSLPTIRQGIDAATAAMENNASFSTCDVWVAKGTYYVFSTRKTDTLLLASGVELYGGFTGTETVRDERDFNTNKTIISGLKNEDDDVQVFHVVTGADESVIDGFVIRDGYAKGPRYGAGMYNDRVSPTVRNCTFTNNVAGWYGGGMFNNHSAAIVENCLFVENEAYGGGGMFNQVSTAQVSNCVFEGNVADEEGGGMFNHSFSNLFIRNCEFKQNEAGKQGGGVSNFYQTSPTFGGCTFADNLAGEQGNDVYNSMSSSPTYADESSGETSSYATD